MKIYLYFLVSYSFLSFSIANFHHHFHRKRSEDSESSTHIGPSLEDKEVLREALHLLNVGKKTLGLGTESPDLLMQLIENSSDKVDQVQKLLKSPFQNNTLPKGEQYLALSGQDGQLRVDNYTNTTANELRLLDKESGEDDIFKMVMEKRYPDRSGNGKLFHKITIIESNQLKPFDEKEFPVHTHAVTNSRLRRHKSRSLKRFFSIPHPRKKRAKDLRYILNRHSNDETIDDEDVMPEDYDRHDIADPVAPLYNDRFLPIFRFRRNNFPKSRIKKKSESADELADRNYLEEEFKDKIINLHSKIRSSSTKKPIENTAKSDTHEIISLERSLISQFKQFSVNNKAKDDRLRMYFEFGVALFIALLCFVFALVIYRVCLKNKNLKTLELKGTNVVVKLTKSIPESLGRQLGLLNKNKTRRFRVPFGKMDYELVPMEEPSADLEWQSEAGEWLKDQDLDMKGIYT